MALAVKDFTQCVRLKPDHVASLSNLAAACARLNDSRHALERWKQVLNAGPAPAELVQNAGRYQQVLKSKRSRWRRASPRRGRGHPGRGDSEGPGYEAKIGYLYMRLVTTDGKTVGWQKNKDYHDRWCFTCGGQAKVKCPQPECDHGKIERLHSQQVNVDPFNKKAIFEERARLRYLPEVQGPGLDRMPRLQGREG